MNATWRLFSAVLLPLGTLAGVFVVLHINSGSPAQRPAPAATRATDRLYAAAASDTETCPEPPPVDVPEKGPGQRVFGSCQAFESDSELWVFLDVDVIIPRLFGSPSYGEYQLALHTFVLDKNGVKARHETPPTVTSNANITCFFPHNGHFFACEGPSGSRPARFFRWTKCGFEELSSDDGASLAEELGIAGWQFASIEDSLLGRAMRNGFRRIADDGPYIPPQSIASDRLGLQVRFRAKDSPNQVVAESADGGETWREVLVEIDPHWSGTAR